MLSCCSWNFGHEGPGCRWFRVTLGPSVNLIVGPKSQSLLQSFLDLQPRGVFNAITCENGSAVAVARRQLQFGLREKPVKLKMARCSDDSPCNGTSFSEPLFSPFHSQRLLNFTFTQ